MVEWIQKDDPRKLFLKPRENVFFTESWPIENFSGKFFEVLKNQTVKYDVWKLVAQGSSTDIDLTDDNGWLPQTTLSLYEINLTMKGQCLLYVLWPADTYLFSLEKAGFKPEPTDDTKRYIGFFEESDIPFDQTGNVLKLYLVKNMDPIRLRIYNDSISDEKVVLRFMINRCRLNLLKEKPSIYRTIFYHKDFKW